MKLKTIVVTVALAALLPAAALADAGIQADKANGARTCGALRDSLGAVTFKQTYPTLGACISAWAKAEHRNRHAAEATCDAQHPTPKPGVYERCVQAKQKAARIAARTATVNAARTCKAERTAMGAAAFTTKYGTRANAFGKCVSKIASAKPAAG